MKKCHSHPPSNMELNISLKQIITSIKRMTERKRERNTFLFTISQRKSSSKNRRKKIFIILFENKLFTYDTLITCLQVSDKSYYFCSHSLCLYIYDCACICVYMCVCKEYMDLRKSSHNNLQKALKNKKKKRK